MSGEPGDPWGLHRVRLAQLRQEVSAPVAAIVVDLERLLGEVRARGIGSQGDDLQTMLGAARRLQEMLATVLDEAEPPEHEMPDPADLVRRIRHDLRTPLNLVKGYGEMVEEDLAAVDDSALQVLRTDLIRLLEDSDAVLERIDTIVDASLFREGTSSARPGRPADADRASAETPRSASLGRVTPPRNVEPGRVLVVDDLEGNRVFLEQRLRREGHEVSVAASGAEALSRLATEGFDVILLDLLMPGGLDGFEVLVQLKASEHLRDIPVIVISALSEMDSAVKCIEAGAEDYLPKPFNPILLRARLSASLERKRWRDRGQRYLEQIRHAATHDQLTDLANRHHFMEALATQLERAKLEDSRRALLFIDLDGFKAVNDTLGHEAGDVVLREVADRLRACVPEDGMLARIGGDEFVMLLGLFADPAEAAGVARGVISAIAEPLLGGKVRIGSSVGIALVPDDGSNADQVLREADAAMYAVKRSGRNGFRFVSETRTTG